MQHRRRFCNAVEFFATQEACDTRGIFVTQETCDTGDVFTMQKALASIYEHPVSKLHERSWRRPAQA